MRLSTSQHRTSQCQWLAIFLLLLCSCAPQQQWLWQHPQGFDSEKRQLALEECVNLAEEELKQPDFYRGYFYRNRYFERHDYPYRSHYNLSHDLQFKARKEFLDRQRYLRICMKAKGWKLTRQDSPDQQ